MSAIYKEIHLEIARTEVTIENETLKSKIFSCLQNAAVTSFSLTHYDSIIKCTTEKFPEISKYVDTITINGNIKDLLNLNENNVVFHFYKNHKRSSEIETFENGVGADAEEVPASNHWILPTTDFEGIWENLLYEDGLKENLLKFVQTTMHFSNKNVNSNIIACNKIVLLHGPPGTGKTSLCKALAQKLAIRLKNTYKFTHLIEINSHSLFSKWFSESGKLVMKLFTKIREIVDHPKSLVCVLIDEVESIAYARNSISGDEPRDALRVVNAVLTQLDQIQKYPNVLILTTSNLTSTIDLAFIDRADIKQFIGYPTVRAIYEIYTSAIRELKRVNIINNGNICPFDETISKFNQNPNCLEFKLSLQLLDISKNSVGLSGRTLRKIPFLAHSLLVNADQTTLEVFLRGMSQAVTKYLHDQNTLSTDANRKSCESNHNNI